MPPAPLASWAFESERAYTWISLRRNRYACSERDICQTVTRRRCACVAPATITNCRLDGVPAARRLRSLRLKALRCLENGRFLAREERESREIDHPARPLRNHWRSQKVSARLLNWRDPKAALNSACYVIIYTNFTYGRLKRRKIVRPISYALARELRSSSLPIVNSAKLPIINNTCYGFHGQELDIDFSSISPINSSRVMRDYPRATPSRGGTTFQSVSSAEIYNSSR